MTRSETILRRAIESFMRDHGMSRTAFGSAALIDPSFVAEFEAGRSPRLATADRLLAFTRVVLAAPDKDTAQWSADSLGRAEIEEVSEAFSYGANTIRDGVSLTPKRELRPLALASEIMQLPNLQGYLKFPGPLPVAGIKLGYVARPKAAERFVPRKGAPESVAAAREDATGTDSEAAPAEDAEPETLQGLLPLELPDDMYEPAAITVEDAGIVEPEAGPEADGSGNGTARDAGAAPVTSAEAARTDPVDI